MTAAQAPSGVRVRLFGEIDVEGEDVDPTVRLRPLSRSLLARLTLSAPGERLDTQELAKQLVIKVAPGVPVAPDKLSSAQQQLRNAQWELRKRLGDGRVLGRRGQDVPPSKICAKLVKPYGSPLHGELSYLAFTPRCG